MRRSLLQCFIEISVPIFSMIPHFVLGSDRDNASSFGLSLRLDDAIKYHAFAHDASKLYGGAAVAGLA